MPERGRALKGVLEHDDLIVSVCARHGTDPDVVRALLALEADFPNLHGWGQRPSLRREMARIMDASFAGESAEA